MAIQANPKHTIVPLIVAVIAMVLWLWTPGGGAPKDYYINRGLVFGTKYDIQYESTRDLHTEITKALKDFDNSLSMFNSHSVITAVNDNRDTIVDALFETMLNEAQRVNNISNGAFDITVAPLVNYWGFGTKGDQCLEISDEAIDSIRTFVGLDKVQLHEHRIIKDDPRVQLDASAVAKGQACDVIAAVLAQHGCTNYMVEIGGEVVAHGVNAHGHPWGINLAVPNPNNEGASDEFIYLPLKNACIATSGNYFNYHKDQQGERRSHTIDPRTGYPVQHALLSATVVSPSCMRSDALATACMVLGEDEALDMIERAEDAACLLQVLNNGKIDTIHSQKWEKMITK